MLPDWAPNVHPLIVHFPIGLVFVAMLFDAAALFLQQRSARWAATVLYALAAVGAVAAFFTGRAASETVVPPVGGGAALTAHADSALWLVWFVGLYALVRLVLTWRDDDARRGVHAGVLVVGLVGVFLVWQTAERGARLVFEYGLGVQTAAVAPAPEPVSDPTAAAAPITSADDGSWRWTPGADADAVFTASAQVHDGELENVHAMAENGLTLHHPDGDPVLFTLGGTIEGVDTSVQLDASAYDGPVRLVHHLQDAANYDFVELDGATVRQGRVRDGVETIFDEGTLAALPEGPVSLRATSSGTHFRAYVDGASVTHGHDDAPSAGPVGLWLGGAGTLVVGAFSATATD